MSEVLCQLCKPSQTAAVWGMTLQRNTPIEAFRTLWSVASNTACPFSYDGLCVNWYVNHGYDNMSEACHLVSILFLPYGIPLRLLSMQLCMYVLCAVLFRCALCMYVCVCVLFRCALCMYVCCAVLFRCAPCMYVCVLCCLCVLFVCMCVCVCVCVQFRCALCMYVCVCAVLFVWALWMLACEVTAECGVILINY